MLDAGFGTAWCTFCSCDGEHGYDFDPEVFSPRRREDAKMFLDNSMLLDLHSVFLLSTSVISVRDLLYRACVFCSQKPPTYTKRFGRQAEGHRTNAFNILCDL
jgi:hypothetical protein